MMRRRRTSRFADLVASTVIVNLKTGDRALRGVLLASHPDLVRLANAQLHEGGQALEVDGELVVPLEEVAFVQIVAPAEAWSG